MRGDSNGYRVARKRYPLAGVSCERCGRHPAVEHHHVDHDPHNERPGKRPEALPRLPRRGPSGTHCKWGHPLSGANVYLSLDGKRRCRECGYRRMREYRARLRAPH